VFLSRPLLLYNCLKPLSHIRKLREISWTYFLCDNALGKALKFITNVPSTLTQTLDTMTILDLHAKTSTRQTKVAYAKFLD
jgi:hypothetical protein